jgi:hypothetical protein
MPCIDFTDPLGQPWSDHRGPSHPICSDMYVTVTDSMTDPNNHVSFTPLNGKAFVDTSSLFFTNQDCSGITHAAGVTLVIRFTQAQQRVTLRLGSNTDGPPTPDGGIAPGVVSFFSQAGIPPNPPSNRVSQKLFPASNAFSDVIYDDCCKPIGAITITTIHSENTLAEICWGVSQHLYSFRFLNQAVSFCYPLCLVRRLFSDAG